MADTDWLTEAFEANRGRLRGVAYRMLGSASEADDAVQEAWLRVNAAGADGVENLGAWLMTITARVCLNMLRSQRSRREEFFESAPEAAAGLAGEADPESEAILADSVGAALQVVLDTLAPPERLAFVLHDLFAMPFDEIAPILGRSATAARQMASRARRRVQGAEMDAGRPRHPHRAIVDAFLTAARGGDVTELLGLLDPDVVLTADAGSSGFGEPRVVRGAEAVVRGATQFPARARWARAALVNGKPGMVLDPGGKLLGALTMEIKGGRITAVDIIGDVDRLVALTVAAL
ncbi:MAG TPA: sigma-70 family RNA polymerase sigma factor [Actinomycetota bacterium]|nr:sigma-70 family RNA polymerase sigma factor [Actinomycetota bacterium]